MDRQRMTAFSHATRFCVMVVANTCLFGGLVLAAASLVLWQMGLAVPGGDLENWAIFGGFLCVFSLILGTFLRIHELGRRVSALEDRDLPEAEPREREEQV
ncbi:MAG: hypothetical protein FJ276_10590 [Planctomycetes bacterium]|nr:hypothetical protein [Planctomycetota bacterium]